MLLHIREVLTPDELGRAQAILAGAPWQDGRLTAGEQSAQAKNNEQLPQDGAPRGNAGASINRSGARRHCVQ